MYDEMRALHSVYSQVADKVNKLYQEYRKRNDLPDVTDTEMQLKVLIGKKYISKTYCADLTVIADYHVKGMHQMYVAELLRYKTRIDNQIDQMLDLPAKC